MTEAATSETTAFTSITPKIINYFRSGQFFNKELSDLRKTNELEPPLEILEVFAASTNSLWGIEVDLGPLLLFRGLLIINAVLLGFFAVRENL